MHPASSDFSTGCYMYAPIGSIKTVSSGVTTAHREVSTENQDKEEGLNPRGAEISDTTYCSIFVCLSVCLLIQCTCTVGESFNLSAILSCHMSTVTGDLVVKPLFYYKLICVTNDETESSKCKYTTPHSLV